jgi:quercetin dioxygenase-like cupin family protein
MGFYQLENIAQEFVTPKHSTAFGPLVTGDHVEIGVLQYKAGEGARPHAHPHEQIILVLRGRVRMTVGDDVSELTGRQGAHIPPHVPHRLEAIEDSEIVSCKNVIDGVGHKI